jgi:predicted amidohydrolase
LSNIRNWAKKAADQGAEFIVFPELSAMGFLLDRRAYTFGQPIPGPATEALVSIAEEVGAIIAAGFVEECQGRFYNAHVLASPTGIVGKYRKTHINPYESPFYSEGNHLGVFDTGKARVGVSICNDNLYPENLTVLALKGAEILVMPFAYGNGNHNAWLASAACAAYRTRGLDLGCFVIAVNNAGPVHVPDGRTNHYPGGAFISDPEGEIVAQTEGMGPEEKMVVATLKAENLQNRRSVPHFTLRLRRPELYGMVSEML